MCVWKLSREKVFQEFDSLVQSVVIWPHVQTLLLGKISEQDRFSVWLNKFLHQLECFQALQRIIMAYSPLYYIHHCHIHPGPGFLSMKGFKICRSSFWWVFLVKSWGLVAHTAELTVVLIRFNLLDLCFFFTCFDVWFFYFKIPCSTHKPVKLISKVFKCLDLSIYLDARGFILSLRWKTNTI